MRRSGTRRRRRMVGGGLGPSRSVARLRARSLGSDLGARESHSIAVHGMACIRHAIASGVRSHPLRRASEFVEAHRGLKGTERLDQPWMRAQAHATAIVCGCDAEGVATTHNNGCMSVILDSWSFVRGPRHVRRPPWEGAPAVSHSSGVSLGGGLGSRSVDIMLKLMFISRCPKAGSYKRASCSCGMCWYAAQA